MKLYCINAILDKILGQAHTKEQTELILLKAPALVFVARLACTLDRVYIAQNKTTLPIQLI